MSNPTDYQFAGMPFTSQGIRELIPELLNPGVYSRSAMIDIIRAHHLSHGGLDKQDITGATKKALSDLRAAGAVEQVSAKGYWRVLDQAPPSEAPSVVPESSVDVSLTRQGPDTVSLSLSVYVTIQSPDGSQTIELIPRPS